LQVAFDLYTVAAVSGHPKAQTNLGQMLLKGEGAGKDVHRLSDSDVSTPLSHLVPLTMGGQDSCKKNLEYAGAAALGELAECHCIKI
jgi:TPR repeat protein